MVFKVHNPFIIDVEASGFAATSYPIEVGAALDDGEKYCALILPAADWTHWDEGAEKVHGITRETLRTHGKPIIEVALELNHLLRGKTLYTDGWVVDRPWLVTLFHAAQLSMAFHVSPLEIILSEPQMRIWHETKDKVIHETTAVRHRASADAWVIQETYKRSAAAVDRLAT